MLINFKGRDLNIIFTSKETILNLAEVKEESIRKLLSDDDLSKLEKYHTSARVIALNTTFYIEEVGVILTYTSVSYLKGFLDLIKYDGYVESELSVVEKLTSLGYTITPKPASRFYKNVHHDILVDNKVVVEISSEFDETSYNKRRSNANFSGYSFVNVQNDISQDELESKIRGAMSEYPKFKENADKFAEILSTLDSKDWIDRDKSLIKFKCINSSDTPIHFDDNCLIISDNKDSLRGYEKSGSILYTWQQGEIEDLSSISSIVILDNLELSNHVLRGLAEEVGCKWVSSDSVLLAELLLLISKIEKDKSVTIYYEEKLFDSIVSVLRYSTKDGGENVVTMNFSEFYPMYKSRFSRVNFYKDMLHIVHRAETIDGSEIIWRFKDLNDLFDSIPRANRQKVRYVPFFKALLETIPHSRIFIGDEEVKP